jgi:hypothetical protein
MTRSAPGQPGERVLQYADRLRAEVRAKTRCATTFGYGPRYLHSTGPLHKGGSATGVFRAFTAAPAADLPAPGESYSSGVLEHARASGDVASLDSASRRALHVHLPRPDAGLLREACEALAAGLSRTRSTRPAPVLRALRASQTPGPVVLFGGCR